MPAPKYSAIENGIVKYKTAKEISMPMGDNIERGSMGREGLMSQNYALQTANGNLKSRIVKLEVEIDRLKERCDELQHGVDWAQCLFDDIRLKLVSTCESELAEIDEWMVEMGFAPYDEGCMIQEKDDV